MFLSLAPLFIKIAMWIIGQVMDNKTHKLEEALASERREITMMRLQKIKDDALHNIALMEQETEAGIEQASSRKEVKLIKADVRNQIKEWSDEEKIRYLKDQGLL